MNTTGITKALSSTGLLIRKFSPQILTTTGVVGVIASTVMACKATLSLDDILDKAALQHERIDTAKEDLGADTYSDKDVAKDKMRINTKTGMDIVKLYAPAATIGLVSVVCIVSSTHILSARNAALGAAYKTVQGAFSDYRRRVVEEMGEDKDQAFRYGITTEDVTLEEINEETGKVKKIKSKVSYIDEYSEYARFFDDGNPNWSKTPEFNLAFLRTMQSWANDKLKKKGVVFLNEVYAMLGLPYTQAGAVVGWKLGNGDDKIDFGMYDVEHYRNNSAFINGLEPVIIVDFNVDGVIYDLM